VQNNKIFFGALVLMLVLVLVLVVFCAKNLMKITMDLRIRKQVDN